MLDHKVSLLPFWLPQMDKDIRKPAIAGYTPHASSDNVVIASSSKTNQNDTIEIAMESDHEPNEEGNKEYEPLLSNSKKSGKSKFNVKSFLGRFHGTTLANKNVESSNNKRIVLPVRIEPKVFFANERTFLSWLHFCIVLGGLALGLLNFGDRVGQISGIIFTIVAMMFILYALFLYQWRATQIRNRRNYLLITLDPGPYDDRIGPNVLVTALFFAILTNFYLKFKENRGTF